MPPSSTEYGINKWFRITVQSIDGEHSAFFYTLDGKLYCMSIILNCTSKKDSAFAEIVYIFIDANVPYSGTSLKSNLVASPIYDVYGVSIYQPPIPSSALSLASCLQMPSSPV